MTVQNPIEEKIKRPKNKPVKMTLLVGVRAAKEADYFFSRGADEVYCGLPEIPNHGIRAENFPSMDELLRTIDLARALGKKAFLVANDVFPAGAFPHAARTVSELVGRGAGGVIIRDLALLEYFKKKGIKTHFTLSTLALCFNSSTVEFFRDRGISRVVLPQQLSPKEAAPFFRLKPPVAIEIFCLPLFYEVNLNCMCSLSCPCSREIVPGKKPVPYSCRTPLKRAGGSFTMPMPDNRWLLNTLYDFYHMGADCLKVARGPNVAEVIEVFNTAVYLMKLLEKGISRELFVFEGERAVKGAQNYGKNYIDNPLDA